MPSKVIKVLLTGRGEAVGKVVIEGLKPEVEVIHFTLASNIDAELPLLFRNKVPPNPSSTLGSGDWSSPPVAVLVGGAMDNDVVARIRKFVYEDESELEGEARRIPWLRVDARKAPLDPLEQPKEYGEYVVGRMKEELVRLDGEGRLGEGEGGVVFV